MKRGKCASYDCTKTQVIEEDATSGSLLNSAITKFPFELHLPGHNFTRPGTQLHKRLNAHVTPREWSIIINRVDNAAYHHDLYCCKHNDTKTRNQIFDKTRLNELDDIVNPTLREKINTLVVGKLIKLKLIVWLSYQKRAKIYPRTCR